MNKIVSVIIPMYNAAQYIEETINSVVSQTYTSWECIVVDDGSVDNSAEIVQRMAENDDRIVYVYQNNSGPSAARNNGLSLAKGEYIQFLDADDILLPDRFAIMIEEYVDVQPNVILYSNLCLGNNTNIKETIPYQKHCGLSQKYIGYQEMYGKFALDFSFIPGAILFPKKVLENVMWNIDMRYSEDWDYYLQLTKRGFLFKNIPIVLFVYRMTPTGLSTQYRDVLKANYLVIERYFSYSYFLLALKRLSANVYKNIMHIKHKRMKNFVVPKMNVDMFILLFFLPLGLLMYFFQLKQKR